MQVTGSAGLTMWGVEGWGWGGEGRGCGGVEVGRGGVGRGGTGIHALWGVFTESMRDEDRDAYLIVYYYVKHKHSHTVTDEGIQTYIQEQCTITYQKRIVLHENTDNCRA